MPHNETYQANSDKCIRNRKKQRDVVKDTGTTTAIFIFRINEEEGGAHVL